MIFFEKTYCLYCDGEIIPEITWEKLFLGPEEQYLCKDCQNKLERIEGTTCKICDRPLLKLSDSFRKGEVCLDCYRWEETEEWQGVLTKNTSLYIYNDFLKEVIAKFKYRGDYELVNIFVPEFKKAIRQIDYDWLVPIPLSDKRLYERGFNQTEALIREAGEVPRLILRRIHTEKQSKKSRMERIQSPNVFALLESSLASELFDKTILLVDDIYTTGTTLRQAATILRKAGARNVLSLTIARG